MAGPHRSTRRADGHDAGLIQTDKGKKETDSDRIAVAQRRRNRFHHPLPQAEEGHQDKENSGDEYRSQSLLPSVAEDVNYGKCDEGVFAHVGGDGERAVGIKAHQQRAENGRQDGCRQRRARRHARGFKDGGIDGHDVRHGEEGGQPGDEFAADRGLVTREFEVSLDPAVQNGLRLGRENCTFAGEWERMSLFLPLAIQRRRSGFAKFRQPLRIDVAAADDRDIHSGGR